MSTRIGHEVKLATSVATTFLRGGVGVVARPAASRPALLFELYEFEACPYCRLVREALTELDLDVIIYPCPKGGRRFRPVVAEQGGKQQFPFFIDPNTGRQFYESADIVRYLFETYGSGSLPLHWRWIELQQLGSGLAGLARGSAGRRASTRVAGGAPGQLLELYSFESSPFARLVRERLCELEIPYILRSTGRTTAVDWVPPALRDALKLASAPETVNRLALQQRAGRISIPYLIDPNTGIEMAESARIIDYLDQTYG
jgi:glutaredoxin